MKEFPIVLIPIYQGNMDLIFLLTTLKEEGYNKIVVVDDGSGPYYSSLLEKAKEYATIISYPENRGKGYALKYGMKYIIDNYNDDSYFIVVPGNERYSITEINKISNALCETKKVVVGERDKKAFNSKGRISCYLSNVLISLGTKCYVKDSNCSLRGFLISDIPWLLTIKANGYEYDESSLIFMVSRDIDFTYVSIKETKVDKNKVVTYTDFKNDFMMMVPILQYLAIPIISFLLTIGITCLFNYAIFKNNPNTYESTLIITYALTMFAYIGMYVTVFKMRRKGKIFYKTFIFSFCLFLVELISIEIFTRCLNISLPISILIGYLLFIFPLYLLIKRFALLFERNK